MPQNQGLPPSFKPIEEDEGLPSSFKPINDEPNLLQRGWSTLVQPLTDIPSRIGSAFAEDVDQPTLDEPTRIPFTGGMTWKGLIGGMAQGAGDVASSFTSPLALATSLAGLSPVTAAIPRTAGMIQKGAGTLFGGEGLYRLATAPTLAEKMQAIPQIAMGAAPFASSKSLPTIQQSKFEQVQPIAHAAATSLQSQGTTRSGLPIYNTPQFGLRPREEALPYPQNIVPNRLRAPSTNAIVFDALLPEKFKVNAQGAAVPLTTSIERGGAITKYSAPNDAPILNDKPPLNESTPIARTAKELVIPPTGKPISAFGTEVGSPNIALMKRAPQVVEPIVRAYDTKTQWVRSQYVALSDVIKGLSASDRIALGKHLDGVELSTNPNIISRANQAKGILDAIFADLPEGVGYQERYLTHIAKQPDWIRESIRDLYDWNGVKEPFIARGPVDEPTGSIGDMYDRSVGQTGSPFAKRRTGAMEDYEFDVKKVWPIYIESIAKEIFDKPARDQALAAIKDLPSGYVKEMAQGYVKNYTGYDAEQTMARAWSGFTNSLVRMSYRNILPFNVGLHTLHAGEIPLTIWPELGSKYTLQGLKSLSFSHTWNEMADLGLLQNNIRTWEFKTPLQRFDAISNFMGYVEAMVKGTAYHGAKAKFIDQGMNANEASMAALRFAKDATLTVDPARSARLFTPESHIAGGVIGRLGLLYRQAPTKMLEQFAGIVEQAKQDPAKAARLAAGITFTGALTEMGIKTLHVSPTSMASFTLLGPLGKTVGKVYGDLIRGDLEGAIQEAISFAIPAAGTARMYLK